MLAISAATTILRLLGRVLEVLIGDRREEHHARVALAEVRGLELFQILVERLLVILEAGFAILAFFAR